MSDTLKQNRELSLNFNTIENHRLRSSTITDKISNICAPVRSSLNSNTRHNTIENHRLQSSTITDKISNICAPVRPSLKSLNSNTRHNASHNTLESLRLRALTLNSNAQYNKKESSFINLSTKIDKISDNNVRRNSSLISINSTYFNKEELSRPSIIIDRILI